MQKEIEENQIKKRTCVNLKSTIKKRTDERTKVKVILVSDTHAEHSMLPKLPKATIMVHGGDITQWGSEVEVKNFDKWLGELKNIKHKIIVAGNHDLWLEKNPDFKLKNGIMITKDTELEVEGIKIFASPFTRIITPTYKGRNKAFTHTDDNRDFKFSKDLDIVLLHSPPFGAGDTVISKHSDFKETRIGEKLLMEEIKKKKPRLVVFGHAHEAYGEYKLEGCDTVFVNASFIVNNSYTERNPPFVCEL